MAIISLVAIVAMIFTNTTAAPELLTIIGMVVTTYVNDRIKKVSETPPAERVDTLPVETLE